jgi:2-oxoglutarate ferredoxin oxidoreductase subunit alpha
MDANYKAVELGYNYVREHYDCPLPIRLETMDATKDCVMVTGNAAAALGCVYAGATVGAWYPITPSTSLMEGFKAFCKRFREDADGTRRYCILQAEDELAALGMVVGAAWAGARAFTPTSGPGISLMSELVGLAYYAEIPAVIFDVQRTGPSTGMPTRTQQGDLLLTAYASHGDTKHIVLYPANPKECFELTVAAFDLADRFQTPVFVLSDLDIGMNDWMCPRLTWDDTYRMDRGKVLSAEEIAALPGAFQRYVDKDGDGVAARTLPGSHPKGGYFARGSGHNRFGGYTEEEGEYVDVVDRIARKINGSAAALPAPVLRTVRGARAGIITVGSCEEPVLEAIAKLSRRGLAVDYLRVRGFPFAQRVADFIDAHDEVFVVEQNRDAQLLTLLRIETGVSAERLRSVRTYGGLPMSASHVVDGVLVALEVQKAS